MPDYSDLISRSPGTDPLVPQPVKGRKKMAHPPIAVMRKLQAQGKAMPPKEPGGRPRFQIRNAAELNDAIRRVGSATDDSGQHTDAERAAVRRHIIRRARELGLSSRIPDTWAADGSLKSKKAA